MFEGARKEGRLTTEIWGALNAMCSDLFIWLFIAGNYLWNRIRPFPHVKKCNCTVGLWHLLEYFLRPFTFPQIVDNFSIAVDFLLRPFYKEWSFSLFMMNRIQQNLQISSVTRSSTSWNRSDSNLLQQNYTWPHVRALWSHSCWIFEWHVLLSAKNGIYIVFFVHLRSFPVLLWQKNLRDSLRTDLVIMFNEKRHDSLHGKW